MDGRHHDFSHLAGGKRFARFRVDNLGDILVHEVHPLLFAALVGQGPARLGDGVGLVGIDAVFPLEDLAQRGRQHLAGEPGSLDR